MTAIASFFGFAAAFFFAPAPGVAAPFFFVGFAASVVEEAAAVDGVVFVVLAVDVPGVMSWPELL